MSARVGSAAGIALIAAGIGIGLLIWAGVLARIDRALLLAMSVRADSAPGEVLDLFTRLGDFWPRTAIALVAAGALLWRGRRRRAGLLVFIIASGVILVSLTKSAVMRARPDLLPHLDTVTTSSFPSAHAANNMIVWLGIALIAVPTRWRGWGLAIGLAIALTIGVSRVVLAVHWPSDVLAGWCFGAGWVLLIAGLARRREI